MVEEALAQFRFAPGNPGTLVVPGYPYSVVGSAEQVAEEEAVERVVKRFRYWKRVADKVQFFPGDPTVKADGVPCYNSPAPVLTLPYRKVFAFIETKKKVSADVRCLTEGPFATPRAYPKSCKVISTDIRLFDEIPTEVPAPVENSCGGPPIQVGYPYLPANLEWPGEHTFYTPLFVKDEGDPKDEEVTPLRYLSFTGLYKTDETDIDRTEWTYWTSHCAGSWSLFQFSLLEGAKLAANAYDSPQTSVYASSTIQPVSGDVVNAPLVGED